LGVRVILRKYMHAEAGVARKKATHFVNVNVVVILEKLPVQKQNDATRGASGLIGAVPEQLERVDHLGKLSDGRKNTLRA
jgi:hypothetical protein